MAPIGQSAERLKRSYRRITGALLALAVAAAGPPGQAAQPLPVTDETVEAAIQRAVTWLKAQCREGRNWEPGENRSDQFWGGDSGLATLALLYAGENPRSESMRAALDWLAAQTLNGTYAYGTRAHALALVSGNSYRRQLERDMEWLVQNIQPRDATAPGAYDYGPLPPGVKSASWDNSNSQYGVLGAWMATDAGLVAPTAYWELVAQHWLRTQQPDGGWGYHHPDKSTGSMTAAGLATLFVALDRLNADDPKESSTLVAAIDRGLTWLGREYVPDRNPFGEDRWLYYYLYGVERAGRASGYKYFRNKDWFHEGAAFLLSRQEADGRWPTSGELMSDLRNTCFGLMFLCHGRAPLLFSKLAAGPDGALPAEARLRDVAGLTHFAQRTLERLLNWQIVRLDSPIDDLLEAPVLYLRGVDAWTFSEPDVQKIREYSQRGGLVLAVCGGPGFAASARTLAEQAFPEYRLKSVPSTHPLYSGETQFALDPPPPLEEVTNGLRTLFLLSPQDLAQTWARGRGRREDLQLGCNIFNYATDKTAHRSRLQTPTIPLRAGSVERKVEVALIRYDGPWNLEPYGWTRLRNYLNNEAATRLLVTSGLTFDSEELKNFKIAYLTGLGPLPLAPAEQKGLQRFLRDGGTLLADAAGGADAFRQALEAQVSEALKSTSAAVPADSFLFSGQGIPGAVDLAGIGYSRAARGQVSGKYPPLRAWTVGHRFAVIYSPLDVTAGLLGTQVFGRRGYDADGCLRVLRNLLLYAELPMREKARLARE